MLSRAKLQQAFSVVVLALSLLALQHLALVHPLEHVATHAVSNSANQLDHRTDQHFAAESDASDTCLTCLALIGVSSAPPASLVLALGAPAPKSPPRIAVPPAPTFHAPLAFRSRAPPLL